jgi:hypothetical protein
MLNREIRTAHPAAVKRETPHRKISRHAAGRNFGKKAVALAMAPIGAAAITLTGLAATAPGASAATLCVDQTFTYSNTYQVCVDDLQVLLNDLWYSHAAGPDKLIATDGYFGPNTGSDVANFNFVWGRDYIDTATPATWYDLCYEDNAWGYHGTFWHNAGCATEPAP